ncbi:YozE family protein [Planococcus sp. FY231025]|uniref:YozE family protein n=1 Tax=Planococcus sp. FY231025 TaxID=3455699 RepID=UPI003F8F9554
MDFKEWLIQYKGRNSRRGDLATDVANDRRFPRGSDRAVLYYYLKRVRHAIPEAIAAFNEAWRAYSGWRKRNLDAVVISEIARLEARIRELEGVEQECRREEWPDGSEEVVRATKKA